MVLKVADFGLALNLREERAVTRVGEQSRTHCWVLAWLVTGRMVVV